MPRGLTLGLVHEALLLILAQHQGGQADDARLLWTKVRRELDRADAVAAAVGTALPCVPAPLNAVNTLSVALPPRWHLATQLEVRILRREVEATLR